MIKRIVLFILLSLSSLAALAVPTVTDVEATINSGDYAKAKEQIKEVLKVHPDSVVANKYMLEVIKIEYAGSLEPSVEYKVYENKLAEIAKAKAERIAAEKKAQEEKERAEFWAGVRKFMSYLLIVVCFIVIVAGCTVVGRKQMTAYREQKRKHQWIEKSTENAVAINRIFSPIVKAGKEEFTKGYRFREWDDLLLLNRDNLDVIQALKDNNYSERMIDEHFSDAWKFIDKAGLE